MISNFRFSILDSRLGGNQLPARLRRLIRTTPPSENQKSKIENNQGFALVVILAFVVLLTVLVLAYFSYSSLQRQISSSSSSQATVDIFAQGAINTLVSDFKQEIYAGSTNSTYGTNTVSIPLAPSNAAPVRVGTQTNLPNLVKRSAGGQAFFPGGPSRASSVSSTMASRNGRSISLARWNQALLLPKADTNSVNDLTPVAAFAAPDWIYVNRGGGNPTAWNTALRWNPSTTDTNVVVGRYSYAIYDEGGILDVNVAGYPPGTTNAISGYKNPLSYADLTQVGLNTNTISALVGWRNAASAQPSGSFPNYSFGGLSQTNFYRNVSTNAYGFLRTANTNLVSGESDRMFLSRQHFLQFLNSLADAGVQDKAALQNSAQYLGTFSRALEQPSFRPHPNRPKIIGSAAPPAAEFVNSYLGNNDAWGGDDIINPSFLSLRAGAAFSRWDGTQAVAGEPLVKKRFSLKRLAWLTLEGPSSTASPATQARLVNGGIPQALINEGTSENILECFGLTWDGAAKTWTYNHGTNRIKTLGEVAAENREPDFFELLKASIAAGSLAKAGPNLHNNQDNYQYALDVALDYQVLQIGANLIDQFDSDSFPSIVQISAGPYMRPFRGLEDLPYFYRYHRFVVVTRQPNPLLSKNESVTFPAGTPTLGTTPGALSAPYVFKGARAGNLGDPGSASLFYVAEVWNPHDAGGPAVSAGPRPDKYRVQAVTQDPVAQTGPWEIGSKSLLQNRDAGKDIVPSSMYPTSNPPTAPLSGSLEFRDAGGTLFREPTLLWRPSYPTGAALAGNSLATDVHTGQTFTGILIAETPISMGMTISGTNYVFQGLDRETVDKTTGAKKQVTFRVQYWDGASWITYDEKYPDLHVPGEPRMIVNKADMDQPWQTTEEHWRNPMKLDVFEKTATSYDPRTARYGVGTAHEIGAPLSTGAASPTGGTLEISTSNGNSNTAAKNVAIQNSNFTIMETQRPRADRGNKVLYSNPGMTSDPGKNREMRIFSGVGFSASNGDNAGLNQFDGLWSQNDPALLTLNRQNSASLPFYYQDADGVARRAMGAYADKTLASTASTVGLPLATANTYPVSNGVGTPTSQNQSRPLILNRPFRSVAEMSYAYKGSLWKQIDFFTPESGDTALLDVFCVEEPPADGMVAGKVNLNTRQAPVLQAVLAGAYREELANFPASLPAGTSTSPLSAGEAGNIAAKLVALTTDPGSAWRGPLSNVGELVGRYVPNPGSVAGATDAYTFVEPVTNTSYTFAGLSAALDSTVYSDARGPVIQRLREAGIRPLASVGQVRVWNVLVDMVAQVGRFSSSAGALDQFSVEGERRLWVHLAIDRATGKVIDRQVELVSE